MAADVLATRGVQVTLCEAKPSVGRKFLMAGKSGLNLTKDEPLDLMLPNFFEAAGPLEPMVRAFDAAAVKAWANALGQPVFTGSTGRVFPKTMKASPLLRSWLTRLAGAGVQIKTNMRWQGWAADTAVFDTPNGRQTISADVTVLALGGASWSRLGSDGAWVGILNAAGVPLADFSAANVGVKIDWSPQMRAHFGKAIKAVCWMSGEMQSRGEATISDAGLEGGGIYSVSRAFRDGRPLTVDLLPDLSHVAVANRLSRPRGKTSLANHLRRVLRLDPVKIALAQEFCRPLPTDPGKLALILKSVPVRTGGPRPTDQAISVAGGVRFEGMTEQLMLKARPGVFCAGEMLDWEAPTGGYLITGCLATGQWAGRAAADYLEAAA
jgi:uncharacterized flavoprotein (TIGR03862 family)